MPEFNTEPPFCVQRRPKRGLCAAYRCSSPSRSGDRGYSRFCVKHDDLIWRARNPYRAYYGNLKKSANKRGIDFTLTYGEFVLFCVANEERGLTLRGGSRRKGDSLTIDRIKVTEGYCLSNIQLLTREDNSRKRNTEYQEVWDGVTLENPF